MSGSMPETVELFIVLHRDRYPGPWIVTHDELGPFICTRIDAARRFIDESDREGMRIVRINGVVVE